MTEGAQRIIAYDRLSGLVGERVGLSRWEAVDQDQVNLFAEATGDHQWIHVDPERLLGLLEQRSLMATWCYRWLRCCSGTCSR